MNDLIESILTERKAGIEEALKAFDSLPPASLEFMHGRWKGFEIETGRMRAVNYPLLFCQR